MPEVVTKGVGLMTAQDARCSARPPIQTRSCPVATSMSSFEAPDR